MATSGESAAISEDQYDLLAARRTSYDEMMWQAPALSLTAQAFLFTIALGPGSTTAARLKGETGDERTLGAKLGARYVLEGSIRKGGSGIRVTAQLVDAQTGAQLWAETYNRDLQATSIFAA